MNRLCELLSCKIPIIQAPTGSIAGVDLASAVAKAGGVGGLGLTWTSSDQVADMVRAVKPSGAFIVNYALAFEPKTLVIALECGAPIVTFSWGQPGEMVELCHTFGALVGVQVSSVLGAKIAIESGADFIIAQGIEAGGHVQSTTALDSLVNDILCLVDAQIPLIATGGITTSEDIKRIMDRGAQGVMLGTRYVATTQSLAHAAYKTALVEATIGCTAITTCFDGGWPRAAHRTLRNETTMAWEAAGCPSTDRPGEGDIIANSSVGEPILRYEDTAPRIGMTGNVEAMALYAGEGVSKIDEIPDAGELTKDLWRRVISM